MLGSKRTARAMKRESRVGVLVVKLVVKHETGTASLVVRGGRTTLSRLSGSAHTAGAQGGRRGPW